MKRTSATAWSGPPLVELVVEPQLDARAAVLGRLERDQLRARQRLLEDLRWRTRAPGSDAGHLLGHACRGRRASTSRPASRPARATPASRSTACAKPSTKVGQRLDVRPERPRPLGVERRRRRDGASRRHRPRARSRRSSARPSRGTAAPPCAGAGTPSCRRRSASSSGGCGARGAPSGPRSGRVASSGRSSGYIVFGFTERTPSVSSEIRSISWLPYDGPAAIRCITSSGRTSRRRSSPVNGSRRAPGALADRLARRPPARRRATWPPLPPGG